MLQHILILYVHLVRLLVDIAGDQLYVGFINFFVTSGDQ